jgi:maltooligosyltrehalose trehalohydrolase
MRVFAPRKVSVSLELTETGTSHPLIPNSLGWWTAEVPRLAEGVLYKLKVDGKSWPDPASRYQPQGVHGPSMVTSPRPLTPSGWKGVKVEDAIIYELHVGTFTPEGTLRAAVGKLPHLARLGITVIELLPLAAFPGERNWGYDGVAQFALHSSYGTYDDLKLFLESAHALSMAVILDVVYNHLGPEGNYTGLFAPYLKKADTPWGEAVNFDEGWNHGIREFFLANTRYWLQEAGFDGFRMDAVSLIIDLMPRHILREITDLARKIGYQEGREVLMIAEHLRNNKYVTSAEGFGFHSQWNDDLNHAVFAFLTGETGRHYQNFGSFDDVVKALTSGFVLDGTRLDKHYHYLLGTDGNTTLPAEHVVHLQNHDQVGNRAQGDRMLATYGRAKTLLGTTAYLASPFVPMLFMGEEYGETAPFLFFEDFGDQALIDGVRDGRKLAFSSQGGVPNDPHDRVSFERSKLRWELLSSPESQEILFYYQTLIALKRSGKLGPRQAGQVQVTGDPDSGLITLTSPHTMTLLNFSGTPLTFVPPKGLSLLAASVPQPSPASVAAWGALVFG